jgi:hypothetical protein
MAAAKWRQLAKAKVAWRRKMAAKIERKAEK